MEETSLIYYTAAADSSLLTSVAVVAIAGLLLVPAIMLWKTVQQPRAQQFHQTDYQLKFEWGEVLRFNKRYAKEFSATVFKYNRTCTAANLTYEYKIDIDNNLEIIIQAYKFASNEYRLFPLRFQVNYCVATSKNLVGSKTIMNCGNYTRCTTLKDVRVHICNWAPDPAEFPPLIPSGKYKIELQGIYYSQEFAGAVYGEVYRPFSEFKMKTVIYFVAIFLMVSARPQLQQPQKESPRPYDYQYKVENPPTNTFFGQNENGDQAGRVTGAYYVWLPDGRLMTVEYLVDGKSGFVPRISYQANANPLQG